MSPDSGSPDSGTDNAGFNVVGPHTKPDGKADAKSDAGARALANYQPFVDRCYAEACSHSWSLSRDVFAAVLERSAAKRFGSETTSAREIEEYLGSLHLKDLGLAAGCAQGEADAWEYFVATYRRYLRSAAAAILRCPANSPAACDLADSLFADLYGLDDAKRGHGSLFGYFHGRSSLKTWLRAVLAQRHIDAIRAVALQNSPAMPAVKWTEIIRIVGSAANASKLRPIPIANGTSRCSLARCTSRWACSIRAIPNACVSTTLINKPLLKSAASLANTNRASLAISNAPAGNFARKSNALCATPVTPRRARKPNPASVKPKFPFASNTPPRMPPSIWTNCSPAAAVTRRGSNHDCSERPNSARSLSVRNFAESRRPRSTAKATPRPDLPRRPQEPTAISF
jgi:hypothetical protein